MRRLLTLVIPTYNEALNIAPLFERIERALEGYDWEVIFVDDDSPDGTPAQINQLGAQRDDLRLIRRVGRRGLASACVEGILASNSEFVAIMDADLQHDESRLPLMLERLRSEPLDLVIASRYAEENGVEGWIPLRAWMSRLATAVGRWVIDAPVTDPMSGFFMMRRALFERVLYRLSAKGYKILLDILASSEQPIRFAEIPYRFRSREAGQSKLDVKVLWDYGVLLLDKSIGRIIPIRFLFFVGVGTFGALLHLATLGIGLKLLELHFGLAQSLAVITAMTLNYTLNNSFTYHDKKLRGRHFFIGLLSFYAISSVGAFASVYIADHLYSAGITWWVAGLLGAIISSVWNFAVNSTITWRKRD